MWLQSLVEVVRAHASIDDGQNNENERDDGEEGQRPSGGKIFLEPARLVHPDKLEQEIRHRSKIEELKSQCRAGDTG